MKVGTLIAEAGGFVSAPIYSSVSGTVFKVDTSIDATGYRKPCIIINVEGEHQGSGCHWYGWCRFSYLHQALSSSRSQG
ncbi:Predicted NADH:ubiquinone oxidoreductase%2C subunit RnfC [Segatella copri]|nr:Predicted NADH:ubiquinone oxidoreductase%2C subunit RnfC [Segatella copri]